MIRVLFHHPEDDPSLMPNAVVCMDEYMLEAAGEEVWEEDVTNTLRELGPGSTREAWIEIPDFEVDRLFTCPLITAHLQGAQDE